MGYARLILELSGIFALLGLPLMAVRAYVAAQFDPDVALAIAANSTLANLLTAVALSSVPFASIAGSIWMAAYAGYRLAPVRRNWTVGWLSRVEMILRAVTYLALTLAIAAPYALTQRLNSWWTILIALPVYFIAFLDGGRIKVNDANSKSNALRSLRQYGVTWGSIALAVALTSPMWLPPERAMINGHLVKIYELNNSDEAVTVFEPQTNEVLRIPQSGLERRQYCMDDHSRTLGELLRGSSSRLPACPRT